MAVLAGLGNAVHAEGLRVRWHELPASALPAKAVMVAAGHREAIRAVWSHLCRTGGELIIIAAATADDHLLATLTSDGFATATLDGGTLPNAPHAEPGRIWITTSGTTGKPKLFAHSLSGLTTVDTSGALPPRRWLLSYLPGTYGWWQLVTLSLAMPGQDLVLADRGDLDGWPVLAQREGVDAVSATPTFWRCALLGFGSALSRLRLKQVTLGGEPVDQALLDRLRAVFPQARVTWIYGSSEAGISIVVSDGKAGFPVGWLSSRAPGRPRLSIEDGELIVESDRRAQGLPQRLRTGDLVRVTGDRVQIVGRVGHDVVNVGGSKISRAAVRAVLTAHPDVLWAEVRGVRAPLVGNLIRAQVVVRQHIPGSSIANELIKWCAESLPECAVPRQIDVLASIPLKGNLKSDA